MITYNKCYITLKEHNHLNLKSTKKNTKDILTFLNYFQHIIDTKTENKGNDSS